MGSRSANQYGVMRGSEGGRGRKKITRRQVEAEEEKREPQTVGVTMSRIVWNTQTQTCTYTSMRHLPEVRTGPAGQGSNIIVILFSSHRPFSHNLTEAQKKKK